MVLRNPARSGRPPAIDEEIDPGLLDHIPDVVTHTPDHAPELQRLLAGLQHDMQTTLAEGFARVETSVASLFADLEARLADTTAALERASDENAQLTHARDRYERAFQALKDLTRDIEEAP